MKYLQRYHDQHGYGNDVKVSQSINSWSEYLYALGSMVWKPQMTVAILVSDIVTRVIHKGLDNAGKSTLAMPFIFHHAQTERWGATTVASTPIKSFCVGNILFRAWDSSGYRSRKGIWSKYMSRGSAVVFMIDSADKQRFAEVHAEFWNVIALMKTSNVKILLVLANKQDCLSPASATES